MLPDLGLMMQVRGQELIDIPAQPLNGIAIAWDKSVKRIGISTPFLVGPGAVNGKFMATLEFEEQKARKSPQAWIKAIQQQLESEGLHLKLMKEWAYDAPNGERVIPLTMDIPPGLEPSSTDIRSILKAKAKRNRKALQRKLRHV